MQKTFPARRDALNDVLGFLEEAVDGAGCPMKVQTALAVCVEEIFINIASYAYPDGEGTAVMTVEADDAVRQVRVTLADSGTPFDPLARKDPDTTLAAEDRGIGGLGIFMVKKMCESVSYEYRDGQNVLTMVKAY